MNKIFNKLKNFIYGQPVVFPQPTPSLRPGYDLSQWKIIFCYFLASLYVLKVSKWQIYCWFVVYQSYYFAGQNNNFVTQKIFVSVIVTSMIKQGKSRVNCWANNPEYQNQQLCKRQSRLYSNNVYRVSQKNVLTQ